MSRPQSESTSAEPRIAVLGLGYAGLPVAVAFARRFAHTVGFDRDLRRVEALQEGSDATGTFAADELSASGLAVGADPGDLAAANVYVVAVPTPVDAARRPDLEPLREASRTVGRVLSKRDLVVYESTVFPGATEGVCAEILAKTSGLSRDDFQLGYSPERTNPGDPEHTLERTIKLVAAQDEATLERVAALYEAIVPAGVHRAASIQVAETAKVLENVQRDLNIALVNELAVLCDRLDIDTHEVIDAAATKWNFHRYHPGLVGGHCIGVDPYYLTDRAKSVGFHPEVILAGRRVNDGMGRYVAERAVKLIAASGAPVRRARVAVLGLTFKPNVPDIRNSRVPEIVRELEEHGAFVLSHDPLAVAAAVREEYGIDVVAADELTELDAVVLATPHDALVDVARELVAPAGATEPAVPVLLDVLSALDPGSLPTGLTYWRL